MGDREVRSCFLTPIYPLEIKKKTTNEFAKTLQKVSFPVLLLKY